MKYVIVKQTDDLILDKINVLNMVFKPLGYKFEMDKNSSKVILLDKNGNIASLKDDDCESSEGINRYILDDSRTLSVNFDNLHRVIDAYIYDSNKGCTHIYVQFESSSYLEKYNLIDKNESHDLIITYFNINMNNHKYVIDYYQSTGMLSFHLYNGDDCTSIGLSRGNSSKTVLTVSSYINNESAVIHSSGDENYHKLSCDADLSDKQFEIKFYEGRSNGSEVKFDFSQCDIYKHYSNAKIINNKNIRNILDEIVGSYKEVFPYDEEENGLLGGYLYDAYKNGKPNDRVIGDRFLKAVNIPIKTDAPQRKNRKRKQKR